MIRYFLKISDFSIDELNQLFEDAISIKKLTKEGLCYNPLKGKVLGLIFDKSSTRTRVSFEVGMIQLGGSSIFLSPKDTQIGRGEPIADTARVLSRYLDAVAMRTFSQNIVEEFLRYSSIPVINALTDLHHPCQILSDILTIIEIFGSYKDIKVAYVGDGNNVANSWIEAASIFGFKLSIASPYDYKPDKSVVEEALNRKNGLIEITEDPEKCVQDADVIYTDVWASMGQESEKELREKAFNGYQVDMKLVKNAKKGAVVMHCLPAHRGEEITDEVMESSSSVIFHQAENRLHFQKALLKNLIGGKSE